MHLEMLVAIHKNLMNNLTPNLKAEYNYDLVRLLTNFRIMIGYNEEKDLLKNLQIFDDCLELVCLMKGYSGSGFKNVPQAVRDQRDSIKFNYA